jgi:hypothetical protein
VLGVLLRETENNSCNSDGRTGLQKHTQRAPSTTAAVRKATARPTMRAFQLVVCVLISGYSVCSIVSWLGLSCLLGTVHSKCGLQPTVDRDSSGVFIATTCGNVSGRFYIDKFASSKKAPGNCL